MRRTFTRIGPTAATLLVAGTLLAGCVLPNNRMHPAKEVARPPPLGLDASGPHLAVAVRAVIVNGSSGSWKVATWWDEYCVTLSNPGAAPVVIERVELVDFSGRSGVPGTDPWVLERASQEWWKLNASYGAAYALALGAGAYGTIGVVYYAGLATTGTLSGGAAAATGAATALAVALPVAAVGAYAANQDAHAKVEAEFQRRRLPLPLTLAPGESREGSLFFPVAPGPQRLSWSHRAGAGDPEKLAIDLGPLSTLHFKRRRYFSAPPTASP